MNFPERFAELVVDSPRRILLSDKNGTYTSEQIFNSAQWIAAELFSHRKFKGERIALFVPPGFHYVAGMLAGWMARATMVPLCIEHPPAELEHVIKDSGAVIVLVHSDLISLLPKTSARTVSLQLKKPVDQFVPYNWDYPLPDSPALMLYTSGTTGKPKGVVHTHNSIAAQITALVQAWEWTENDSILHFLPLHHTHGIINKLFCPLWVGAHCYMLPKFEAEIVWDEIQKGKCNLLMAVPTIYSKLISFYDEADEMKKKMMQTACEKFRLMVSGSAALPVSVLEKWKKISGHVLLERYGMTETGMVLSNPVQGERLPGFVGKPLPGIEIRMMNEENEPSENEGELQVKSKTLFHEYWKKAEETKKSFTKDGWFKTGDLVSCENGNYRIVGRLSTDIIKSGGYKISALEIESVFLTHPSIKECAVLGLPDETWGERIGMAIILNPENTISLDELREWGKDKLAAYKLPSLLKEFKELPRNAMGKLVKSEVKKIMS
jgi:malonyl-CoA/methylmalonyl-CoA synthetase